MKYKGINFKKLLAPYHKGWVGISSDFKKVILHGKTLKEARQKAKESKEQLYFFPAGDSYSNFVGDLTK